MKIPSLNLPGSKSITNRALLLSALAKGKSIVKKPLFSDDTRYMRKALSQLGLSTEQGDDFISIEGKEICFPAEKKPIEMFIGNAGTTIRFLTGFLSCLDGGSFILKGEPRMHERPIRDLVEPLKGIGADITYLENDGYPPLLIKGKKLNFDVLEMDGSKSSQYISSLLLLLPKIAPKGILKVRDLVSKPYIDTTIESMKSFGITIAHNNYQEFWIESGNYQSTDFDVPADASSASYFFAAAFLENKPLRLNIGTNCLQGDFLFTDILREMGGTFELGKNESVFLGRNKHFNGITVDMNAIPDTVQTLAVLAMFADSPTFIKNVANLRIKETDRLHALDVELNKLGVKTATGPDFIKIFPKEGHYYFPSAIDTYHDHRMAMSFALATLRIPGMTINDPGVVSKSFENFWDIWGDFKYLD